MIDIFILWSIGSTARQKGRTVAWVLVGLAAEFFFGFIGVGMTESRFGFLMGLPALIGVHMIVSNLDSRKPAWALMDADKEPPLPPPPITVNNATAVPERLEVRELTAAEVVGEDRKR